MYRNYKGPFRPSGQTVLVFPGFPTQHFSFWPSVKLPIAIGLFSSPAEIRLEKEQLRFVSFYFFEFKTIHTFQCSFAFFMQALIG